MKYPFARAVCRMSFAVGVGQHPDQFNQHEDTRMRYWIAALALMGVVNGAFAESQHMDHTKHAMPVQTQNGKIILTHATARFLIAGRPGAVFLNIENTGDADRLISASSPLSDRVELHTHKMDNGVMKMRRIDAITVPSNTVTELKSGGLHIMMFNVENLPEVGSKIPVSLVFEKAGEVKINAVAVKAGAKHSH